MFDNPGLVLSTKVPVAELPCAAAPVFTQRPTMNRQNAPAAAAARKTIRWGVLGAAAIATGRTMPAMNEAPSATLFALASRDLAKGQSVAQTLGIPRVHARYEDLKQAPVASYRIDEGWLVTNTQFTRNAIRYGRCSNLTMIAWDYPRTRGLSAMIEEAHVHPVTALTTLSDSEKRRLLDQKIVLCKSVRTAHLLEENGIAPQKIQHVQEEAKRLCGI